MIRVAALTSGRDVASSRFRVRQHVPLLHGAGIDVTEYAPRISKYAPIPLLPPTLSPKYVLPLYGAWQLVKLGARVPGLVASRQAQLVWLQRQLLPGYLTAEPLIKRPYVYDVDDAIWMARPFGRSSVRRTAQRAAVVVAGNSYLADWFSGCASDVRVIPTAIDTERFRPRTDAHERQNARFVVGWSGSHSTLKFLYEIERHLRRFLEKHPDADLRVIADQRPVFESLPPERVDFIPWSPAVEAEAVRTMDVGLMPLPDDEWSRGKCSFKMLQYMACGIPCVVSPVGMNCEVLAQGCLGYGPVGGDDWYDALSCLYRDRELGRQMGEVGRCVVERRFSRAVVCAQIARVFKELI